MTKTITVCSSLLAVGVILCSARAWGSESFPPIVMREYGLPEEPPCVLCHQTEEGGAKTATRPFAVTMSRLGVAGGNNGTLTAALRTVKREPYDSDGDGYGDYDELVAGLNPNDASDGPEGGPIGPEPYSGPLPRHGCSVVALGSRRRAFGDVPMLVLFGFSLAILVVRARLSRNRRGFLRFPNEQRRTSKIRS